MFLDIKNDFFELNGKEYMYSAVIGGREDRDPYGTGNVNFIEFEIVEDSLEIYKMSCDGVPLNVNTLPSEVVEACRDNAVLFALDNVELFQEPEKDFDPYDV